MAKRGEERGRRVAEVDSPASSSAFARFLKGAGVHYWTASVLPVLVGSTLPFWLRPPGFAFDWVRMVEAVVAVVLLHAASSMVKERGDAGTGRGPSTAARPAPAIACGVLGVAIGLHLNAVTPGNLVLVLGVLGILGGYAYGAPPLRLSHRGLGEITLGLCLGVLPVVGAYYVQAHAVSWRVVLASLPLAFAVVLMLWVRQIAEHDQDAASGKRTLVVLLGARASARGVVPLLAVLVFASLFAAVFTASHVPLSLVAVLAFGLVRTVVAVYWNHYGEPKRLPEAVNAAHRLHLTLGIVMAGSALAAMGA